MMITTESDFIAVHRNRPQHELIAVMTRIMVLLWGRATGKTMGGNAPLSYIYLTMMPGSVGAIGCDSYKHLKRDILPELLKTWKKDFGLEKDRDYWINRFPPKELGIPEAIRPVSDPDNCIFFRNGSVIKLFSFNFAALQNGDSIDWLIVEEAKLVKHDRLNETILCVRGNDDVFGHLSVHKSIVLISDMPDFVKGMWMLDYENEVKPDYIKLIKALSIEISNLTIELEGGVTVRRAKEIEKTIARLDEKRNFLRKRTVFVSYASTLENVHSLGIDTINNFRKTLPKDKFQRSVLNFKPKSIGNTFYNFKDHHAYVAINADYVNQLADKTMPDCRWDTDVDPRYGLEISLDYNAAITCIAVGQFLPKELRLLNTLYVTHPKRLRHAIKKFHEYYKHLPHREVTYHYDHTAKGTDANRTMEETHMATVIDELKKLGWRVNGRQFKSTSHKERYERFNECFDNAPEALFSFRYNKENCRDWEYAALRTPVKIKQVVIDGVKKSIVEKDKSSEKDKTVSPVHATHITEAVDGLLVAMHQTLKNPRRSALSVRSK